MTSTSTSTKKHPNPPHSHSHSHSTSASASASLPPPSSTDTPPACFSDTSNVLTSTTNDLPGYRVVRLLGTVYGLTVRSRNWGVDIGALLRSVVGGEVALFTRLMYAARNEAVERLVGEVLARGGNAVVAMRFDTSPQGTFSQVCAYGTACLVEKID